MIPTLVLRSAASASFVQKSLGSKAAIADYLSSSSWSSSQLFDSHTITDASDQSSSHKTTIVPDSKLIAKLVKQAGLPPVAPGSEREAAIIKDLNSQLVFVDHICEVDTAGIEPLVRLSDPLITLSFDQMKSPIVAKDSQIKWTPTALAAEKNASFYVLKEGLRRED